jgi:uncharacterized protein YggE
MKRIFHCSALIALLAITTANAQVSDNTPVINVSGSAEVKVAPDEIHLNVGVESRHQKLDEAKKDNDAKVATAMAFLKNNGVADKHVQTDFISVEPTYEYSASSTAPKIYIVRKSLAVTLKQIGNFERVLTGLLASGITHVHGIELHNTELRKHRDAARALAVTAAREKADALAKELGVKRGKVRAINANEWGGWMDGASFWGGRYGSVGAQNVLQNAGGASGSAASTLSLGQISVSASVNVSFAIE